MFTLHF